MFTRTKFAVVVLALVCSAPSLAVTYSTNSSTELVGQFEATSEQTAAVGCQKGGANISLTDSVDSGTWGGATVTLQYNDPNGGWAEVDPDTTLDEWTSDSGLESFDVPTGVQVRLAISGGTSPVLGFWLKCDR